MDVVSGTQGELVHRLACSVPDPSDRHRHGHWVAVRVDGRVRRVDDCRVLGRVQVGDGERVEPGLARRDGIERHVIGGDFVRVAHPDTHQPVQRVDGIAHVVRWFDAELGRILFFPPALPRVQEVVLKAERLGDRVRPGQCGALHGFDVSRVSDEASSFWTEPDKGINLADKIQWTGLYEGGNRACLPTRDLQSRLKDPLESRHERRSFADGGRHCLSDRDGQVDGDIVRGRIIVSDH